MEVAGELTPDAIWDKGNIIPAFLQNARRAAALVALVAVAVYWGTLGHGFVWDDHIHIESAPFVQDPSNAGVLLSAPFWLGHVAVEGSGRPLLLASLLGDRALWGDAPAGYHLTNVLLHAAAAAALTLLASALAVSWPVGLLTGLLFALHPVQSEAVCAVSFRADLFAALFVLLALLAARRAHAGRPVAWTAAAAGFFALALLSKENAVVLPALALLADRLTPPPRASARRTAAQLMAFTLVLAAYAAFRVPRGSYESLAPRVASPASAVPAAPNRRTVHIDPSPPPWKAALPTRTARMRGMLSVFLDYARLIVWPSGLQADRSPVLDSSRLNIRAMGGAAVALGLLLGAFGLRRRAPAASLGLVWFLVALTPVSGLVPIHNIIAERYLYLPMAGAALAAAAAFATVARRTRRPGLALALAGVALTVAAGATTARRIPAWRDDASLFAGRIESDGTRLRYNRARLLRNAGRLDEAREEYLKALVLDSRSVESLVNLAEVEGALGNGDEELQLLRRAAGINPGSSVTLEALGAALERRGRRAAALEAYSWAVGADSRSPSAHARYSWALTQAGHVDEARREAEIAAKLDPMNAHVQYARGRLCQDEGRFAEAEQAFRGAVRADFGHALAWANLGVSLHRQGKLTEALGAMRGAVKLLPFNANTRVNLGALLDDMGRKREAEEAYAAAVRLDADSIAAWHAYGVVLQKQGKANLAARAYRRALALDPRKVESRVNLTALEKSKKVGGEVILEVAISPKLDPKNTQVQYARGRLLQDEGRFAEAEKAFRGAIIADSGHALAWANLGVSLHRQGKMLAALDAMRMAAKLLPLSPDARRNLGALFDDMGREREAEEAYAEAVRLDKNSAPTWHAYGVVLQKQGKAAPAARAYERALALDPRGVESLVNLSTLRAQSGDYDGAQALLAEAAALRPRDPVVLKAAATFERLSGRVLPKLPD